MEPSGRLHASDQSIPLGMPLLLDLLIEWGTFDMAA